jgi:pyridoxamine 5'-phosphate oxidase
MASNFDIAYLREEYGKRGLLESELDPDPLRQFQKWLAEAIAQQIAEPNAMTLATVDAAGQPWSRTVLLKGCDARGFSFFTNYESAKGRQLEYEPRCALTFRWYELERQVNVTGLVGKLPRSETEAYFPKRPLGSRLGAWASRQSDTLADRAALEKAFEEARARFGDNPPAPEHWGGYVVRPTTVEFWQGRASRLHDRLCYTRLADDSWKIERLAP